MPVLCVHLVIDQPQTGASGVVRQVRRHGPSVTNKITPCWVTLLHPARRDAVLGQPSIAFGFIGQNSLPPPFTSQSTRLYNTITVQYKLSFGYRLHFNLSFYMTVRVYLVFILTFTVHLHTWTCTGGGGGGGVFFFFQNYFF
jgi:hypothetical protein